MPKQRMQSTSTWFLNFKSVKYYFPNPPEYFVVNLDRVDLHHATVPLGPIKLPNGREGKFTWFIPVYVNIKTINHYESLAMVYKKWAHIIETKQDPTTLSPVVYRYNLSGPSYLQIPILYPMKTFDAVTEAFGAVAYSICYRRAHEEDGFVYPSREETIQYFANFSISAQCARLPHNIHLDSDEEAV
jgi:hypothetical protein